MGRPFVRRASPSPSPFFSIWPDEGILIKLFWLFAFYTNGVSGEGILDEATVGKHSRRDQTWDVAKLSAMEIADKDRGVGSICVGTRRKFPEGNVKDG
ncbi:hypothetical protein E4U39_001825 [Claviceps sp. Clav50 group G5]|nr:hypothetical protein E4U39_001825 [Claviceps sp. Clav50 group G5]